MNKCLITTFVSIFFSLLIGVVLGYLGRPYLVSKINKLAMKSSLINKLALRESIKELKVVTRQFSTLFFTKLKQRLSIQERRQLFELLSLVARYSKASIEKELGTDNESVQMELAEVYPLLLAKIYAVYSYKEQWLTAVRTVLQELGEPQLTIEIKSFINQFLKGSEELYRAPEINA